VDIAFYLTHADHSEKSNIIINTINDMCSNHPYDNIILFNSQYNRVDSDKKFPIIHLSQAKYFRGILLVFDIKSAMITKTFPSPRKQILYLDDMPWSSDHSIPALFWQSIYINPNIYTIAKNQEIYDLFEICWSKPIGTMNNINHKELYDAIISL